MNRYAYVVHVVTDTLEHAEQVINDRIAPDVALEDEDGNAFTYRVIVSTNSPQVSPVRDLGTGGPPHQT